MNEKKLKNLLSMAQRANMLASGEFAAEQAIRGGKAKMLLVAADASAETKKRYENMTTNNGVSLYFVLNKEELGQIIGKEFRAAVVILDQGFAKAAAKCMVDIYE